MGVAAFQELLPRLEAKRLEREAPFQRWLEEMDEEAKELLDGLLAFDPFDRIGFYDALTLPFFDEVRSHQSQLVDGLLVPDLFDFEDDELAQVSVDVDDGENPLDAARAKLVPGWYQQAGYQGSNVAAADEDAFWGSRCLK
jgi:serine/threonine protein kinase